MFLNNRSFVFVFPFPGFNLSTQAGLRLVLDEGGLESCDFLSRVLVKRSMQLALYAKNPATTYRV